MNPIIEALSQIEEYKEYIQAVKSNKLPINLLGLTDLQKVHMMYSLLCYQKSICIIVNNDIVAQKIYNKLLSYDLKDVYYLPKREVTIYDYDLENMDNSMERVIIFSKLLNNKVKVLVTTIESITQPVVDKEIIAKNIFNIEVNNEIDLKKIILNFLNIGYNRVDMVEGKGQFCVRGGIIDIYPSNLDNAVRIELWGEIVDSIKYLDTFSQRSDKDINNIDIYPNTEYILNKSTTVIAKEISKIDVSKLGEKEREKVKENIEEIEEGIIDNKIDKYFSCIYEKHNLLEYLPQNMVIFLDEVERLEQKVNSINFELFELIKDLNEKQRFVPQFLNNIYTYEDIRRYYGNRYIQLKNLDIDNKSNIPKYVFKCRELNNINNIMEILLKQVGELYQKNYTTVLLVSNKNKASNISEMLNENNISNKYVENINSIDKFKKKFVYICIGSNSSSYEYVDIKLAILTDSEENVHKYKSVYRSSTFKNAAKVVLADLSPNDYVVHFKHGIGQFIEINTLNVNNIKRDYIKIKYKNEDVLYVPTDQLDSIRKYVALSEGVPKLNKLGSKEWANVKKKAKENAESIAKDLVELYAHRQKIRGFSAFPDTEWQKQFELDFPYEETEDQLRCIREVKQDMEKSVPMDRLLCGDVGYGKTEVAIRAAFKAVMSGKQVAYLVPTTILAMQQYEVFKERMQKYDIRLDVLSRFKTKKEQENIIKKLKLGQLDVVIGTHRLIQKDVIFKDLGLLIIDEEHRFGVKHKEAIKQLKQNIDVLSMTATPIPRTLHMSIVGIRDMSVIYDPPNIRKPIQTYVMEYYKLVIRDAIIKEIERKGQVFYLYNRVKDIEEKTIEIQKLIPEAKVECAHGQMTSEELEKIMYDFIQGNIDVLICTTILESGIDIQNANTIIIENADRMGLSQLYQIRGRVGRKDRQAYAYITYKRNKVITEDAEKRLKAIKEFTEFGSGFKIALRDLEIRGAGNILGSEQHGHMEAVGYEMYCKMLEDAVKTLQGKKLEDIENNVQIDINISAYIPSRYIENQNQKLEVYQTIALCETFEDVASVREEIIDRYGELPKEVENLLCIAKIKILAKEIGISCITFKGDKIKFDISNENNISEEKILSLIKEFGVQIKIDSTSIIKFVKEKNVLDEIFCFMEKIV